MRSHGVASPVTPPRIRSDGLAAAFKYRVLDHAGHALPAGPVKSGNDIDANDLNKLVVELHCVDSRITQIGNDGNAAGSAILSASVDRMHGLVRSGAGATQLHKLLRLRRRVTNDTNTHSRAGVIGRLRRPFSMRGGTNNYGGCRYRPNNTHH